MENDETNLKYYTSHLINYLELNIVSEIVKNSYIRDLKVTNISENTISISLNSLIAIELVRKNYKEIFKLAIKECFKKDLQIRFYNKKDNQQNFVVKSISKNVNPKYTFDNYFKSLFNQEAINFSKKIINNIGKHSPFFLHSPSGFGKTHLMHAIANSLVEKKKIVWYVNPITFTNSVVAILKDKSNTTGIESFINQYNEADVVIFDDIQYLGNKKQTLKTFFNIIDKFIENEKQIIFTSDKSPNELIGFHERFITRFLSGLISSIKKPNVDEFIEIIEFKLDKKHMDPNKWEREALKFIARNYSSSIRAIEGAIKRISIFSEDISNIEYTYNVVTSMFKDLIYNKDEITHRRIIQKVANFYSLSKEMIIGKSRKKEIVFARQIAIWLIREILNKSYAEIGKIFGGKDHSTIFSSIKKINEKMQINRTIKLAINQIERKINIVD